MSWRSMSDSNVPERTSADVAFNSEERIDSIKRWVAYIEANPAEVWGPQLNTVVDSQLQAARSVQTSVAHAQRVREMAAEILEE